MPPNTPKDIVQTIKANKDMKTLAGLVEQTDDIKKQLSGAASHTIFAPSDKSFEGNANTVKFLQSEVGKTARTEILKQHLLSGVYALNCPKADNKPKCQPFKTQAYGGADKEGHLSPADPKLSELSVKVEDKNGTKSLYIGEPSGNLTKVDMPDINCTNGFIQAFTGLLLPKDCGKNCPVPLKTLYELLDTAGPNATTDYLKFMASANLTGELERADGERTVLSFDPAKLKKATPFLYNYLTADDNKLMNEVMHEHIITTTEYYTAKCENKTVTDSSGAKLKLECKSGKGLLIQGEPLDQDKEEPAKNGVLQYLENGPLFPDGLIQTIVGVAKQQNLDKLVAAVIAADIGSLLSDLNKPVMVVAPSDAAFDKLPKGSYEYLFESDDCTKTGKNTCLQALLSRHVFQGDGVRYLSDIKPGQPVTLKSLSGEDVKVTATKGNATGTTYTFTFMDDEATVTQADVPAANGVINEIDSVLSPSFAPDPKADPKIPKIPTKTLPNSLPTDDLIKFRKVVNESGTVEDELNNKTAELTVFAPVDSAFKEPVAETDATGVLQRHIVRGIFTYDMLVKMARNKSSVVTQDKYELKLTMNTVNSTQVGRYLAAAQEVLEIEGCKVEKGDFWASNGVMHKIDSMITGGTPVKPNDNSSSGLGGGWIFLIVLCILILVGLIAYCCYTRMCGEEKQEGTPAYVKQVDNQDDPNAFKRAFGNDYDAKNDNAAQHNRKSFN